MAESWRAKAKRYARGDFTRAELMGAVGILLLDQAIDVATFGRLNMLKGKALQRVALPLLRATVSRAAVPATASVGRAAFGASRLLMTNPYILGATALYVGVTERERIKQLLEQGYEIAEPAVTPVLEQAAEIAAPIGPGITARRFVGEKLFPSAVKRKKSKFNIAIAAGMRTAKKSKSYGGIGNISPATKVFGIVTKLASAKKKKKKAPKSGIRRKIWNAMKGLR
jgi:hypothetical protein